MDNSHEHVKIFNEHLPLALRAANRFRRTAEKKGIHFDDVHQKSRMILWTTVKKWEEGKGPLSQIFFYNSLRDLNRFVNSRQHFGIFKQTRKATGNTFLYTRHPAELTFDSEWIKDYALNTPERSLLAEEAFEAILTMPLEITRVASLLGHLEGYSYEEIAAEMGVSRMSAYNWCQEALQLVREKICD